MSHFGKHIKSPIFVYNGEPYMRVTPTKRLFNSTTIYEVVNRGDFFAVNLITRILTVLPAGADDVMHISKHHIELSIKKLRNTDIVVKKDDGDTAKRRQG